MYHPIVFKHGFFKLLKPSFVVILRVFGLVVKSHMDLLPAARYVLSDPDGRGPSGNIDIAAIALFWFQTRGWIFDTPPKTNMNDTETIMNEDVSIVSPLKKW